MHEFADQENHIDEEVKAVDYFKFGIFEQVFLVAVHSVDILYSFRVGCSNWVENIFYIPNRLGSLCTTKIVLRLRENSAWMQLDDRQCLELSSSSDCFPLDSRFFEFLSHRRLNFD